MEILDCVIIGSGPCGIAASIELKKQHYKIALVEKSAPGGKVNIAPRVDNYPGFTKIPGPDLAVELYQRVRDAKVPFVNDEVITLKKKKDIFEVELANKTLHAKTVLIASGTKEKQLGFAHEKDWIGRGISYCSICDGHFFIGKKVVVIGGGNSALKEALHLATLAKQVILIHRRNQFRGNDRTVQELKNLLNVKIMTPYVPLEFLGTDHVTGIRIKNVETGQEDILECQGIFPLVGQQPNSSFIKIDNVKDEWGTIPIDITCHTQVEGLFAGGDVTSRPIRQIYVAELDGKKAANSIIEYLNK